MVLVVILTFGWAAWNCLSTEGKFVPQQPSHDQIVRLVGPDEAVPDEPQAARAVPASTAAPISPATRRSGAFMMSIPSGRACRSRVVVSASWMGLAGTGVTKIWLATARLLLPGSQELVLC